MLCMEVWLHNGGFVTGRRHCGRTGACPTAYPDRPRHGPIFPAMAESPIPRRRPTRSVIPGKPGAICSSARPSSTYCDTSPPKLLDERRNLRRRKACIIQADGWLDNTSFNIFYATYTHPLRYGMRCHLDFIWGSDPWPSCKQVWRVLACADCFC